VNSPTNSPALTDPTFTGFGARPCAPTQNTAAASFDLTTSLALPENTSYTLTFRPSASNQIENIYLRSLVDPPGSASTTFNTGLDLTPPIMIDARMTTKNGCASDFGCPGDGFSVTFSRAMDTGGGTARTAAIGVQDQDGTTTQIWCGPGPAPATPPGKSAQGPATCSWNIAATTLTVTLLAALPDNGDGTTPGLQIPFNITYFTGVTDRALNPPNVLGSPDRLVRYR
jgi:hypothetical protein